MCVYSLMPAHTPVVQCLPDGSKLSIPWVGSELSLHINLQELLAVIKVFEASPELRNCVVQLFIDNMCVLHWLAGMKARCHAGSGSVAPFGAAPAAAGVCLAACLDSF
jgi:hypothetical protein